MADEHGRVAHVRPHLLLHAGGPVHLQALVAQRRAGRHPVHRLGADQPRPGAARHRRRLGSRPPRPVDPGLRSCLRARRWSTVSATGVRSGRAGQACVAYLSLSLSSGRHRPRARQLAEPDQDAHDDRRRVSPDAGVGRPRTRASGSASTTAASTWQPRHEDRQRRDAAHGSPTAPATWSPRRCARREALASMVDEFVAARSARDGAPSPTGRPGCGSLRILEAATTSARSGGVVIRWTD